MLVAVQIREHERGFEYSNRLRRLERAVSSAVERLLYTERAGGSIPSLPTN